MKKCAINDKHIQSKRKKKTKNTHITILIYLYIYVYSCIKMNIYIYYLRKKLIFYYIINMIRNAYVYIRKKVCACFHNRPGVMIYTNRVVI